jgi:hypothetical protein
MSVPAIIKQMFSYDGKCVYRAAKSTDLLVAGPTTVNLFTIVGGAVVVEGFVGVVTTQIATVALTIAINLTGTAGTIVAPVAVATGSLSGYVVDSILTLAGGVGAALTLQTGAARGVGVYTITNKQAWVPGVLSMSVGGAAAATGAIDWYIRYQPLGPASKVYAN